MKESEDGRRRMDDGRWGLYGNDINSSLLMDDMTVKEAIWEAEKMLPGTPALEHKEDPRWQAIIAVGEFAENNPEEVWSFVYRWGSSEQEDLRTAVATCLLEHLLEYHFDLIFPRVEEAVKKNRFFEDMFLGCAKFGQSEIPKNAKRFDHLKKKCRLAR